MTRLTFAAGLVTALCIVQPGFSQWEPADGPLMTRWAKDVTPESVWPEYPRPQLVRPKWVNLNGLWDYAIVAKDAPRPETWDGDILVPFCAQSALSGVMRKVTPEQRLWYRRAFQSPELTEGGRLLLHFGAVDWETTVWVNGEQVGSHRGGYDPFSFDITDVLEPGENELVLSVWDPTNTGTQPRGKQVLNPGGIFYTAVTGIWQTVWLEPVPSAHIEGIDIEPNVDAGSVTIRAAVRGDAAREVRVTATADGFSAQSAGKAAEAITISMPDAQLWTPDSPHLYDLQVTLLSNGKPVDEVQSYFAMRKIELKKDEEGIWRLMLNDEPLFQYGFLDQGWWPDGLYTPASDDAMRYDIEMTKKLGMNLARKHVKYECARWYYWADKLGLLVWQDMPSGDCAKTPASREQFERELKAMVDALGNHPSIVMWVPFNEGWGQHDTPRIVETIRQWDGSRLINNASGWTDRGVGDVLDIHSYPGPAMPALQEDRAAVLGEFGGLGLPLAGHTWQDEKNWGYRSYESRDALTEAYVTLLKRLHLHIPRGLCAAVYTQTSDVEVEVNGLLTYDREIVKPDLERAAAAARNLYRPAPQIKQVVPTALKEPAPWRYTTEPPADAWCEADFDDSSWKEGPSGFGREGMPNTKIGTRWATEDIWLRREFELPAVTDDLQLYIFHDEDAEVYINGTLAASVEGYVTNYELVPLSDKALSALKEGNNTMAIHCRQTRGGQYIDAGLVRVIPPAE